MTNPINFTVLLYKWRLFLKCFLGRFSKPPILHKTGIYLACFVAFPFEMGFKGFGYSLKINNLSGTYSMFSQTLSRLDYAAPTEKSVKVI